MRNFSLPDLLLGLVEFLGHSSFHPHEHWDCDFPSSPPSAAATHQLPDFLLFPLDAGTSFPKEGITPSGGKQSSCFLPPSPKTSKAKPEKFNTFYGCFPRTAMKDGREGAHPSAGKVLDHQSKLSFFFFLNTQILDERSSCCILVLNQSDSLCWDLTGDHQ